MQDGAVRPINWRAACSGLRVIFRRESRPVNNGTLVGSQNPPSGDPSERAFVLPDSGVVGNSITDEPLFQGLDLFYVPAPVVDHPGVDPNTQMRLMG